MVQRKEKVIKKREAIAHRSETPRWAPTSRGLIQSMSTMLSDASRVALDAQSML